MTAGAIAASRRGMAVPRRGELFAGLCLLGFANGIVARVGAAIAEDPAGALFGTFGISALVWIAIGVCAVTLWRDDAPADARDAAVGGAALVAILLPVDWLSWIALTGLALHLLRSGRAAARAGWILLTVTGAMFWGRVLLVVAGEAVLRADAALAGWLVGVPREGNTLRFADGGGYVWIAAPCSSLTNLSLAILCWVLFAQLRGLRWTWRGALWCLAAAASVVAINTARIGLIVTHRESFELLHGPVGGAIAGWATMLAVVAICAWGTRHAARPVGA